MALKMDMCVTMGQSQGSGVGNKNTSWIPTNGLCYDWFSDGTGYAPPGSIQPCGDEQFFGAGNVFKPATGSMVPAFAQAFTDISQTPLLMVRCAYGGSALMAINQGGGKGHWGTEGGTAWFPQAITRFNQAKTALLAAGYELGKVFLIWTGGYADNLRGFNLDLPYENPASFAFQQGDLLTRFRAATGMGSEVELYLDKNYVPHHDTGDATMTARSLDIQAAQEKAVEMVPGVHISYDNGLFITSHTLSAGSDGWIKATDGIHFGQRGLNYFGRGKDVEDPTSIGWGGQTALMVYDDVEPPDPGDPTLNPSLLTSFIGERLLLAPSWVEPDEPPAEGGAFIRAHQGLTSKGSGLTLGMGLLADVPPTRSLIAGFVYDNAAGGGLTITSISKPPGEPANWVKLGAVDVAGLGAGAVNVDLWTVVTTVEWDEAFVPTATLSSARTAKADVCVEFSGYSTIHRGAAVTGATTNGFISLDNPNPQAGDLAVAICGYEDPHSATGDPINGWSAPVMNNTLGGQDLSNVTIGLQWQIMTTTQAITFTPTAPAAVDGAAIVAVLQPA